MLHLFVLEINAEACGRAVDPFELYASVTVLGTIGYDRMNRVSTLALRVDFLMMRS